jgi:hypothetical protein
MERSLFGLKQRMQSIRIAKNGQKTERFPNKGNGGANSHESRFLSWVGK